MYNKKLCTSNICCSHYTDCLTTKTSKHTSFTVHTVVHKTTGTQFTQHNARHNATEKKQAMVLVTACHSLQTRIHTILMTTSVRVTTTEIGKFWKTLKLHCTFPVSRCIAIVSSIAIPETVSLLSLQFQISCNTTTAPRLKYWTYNCDLFFFWVSWTGSSIRV